MLLKRAYVPSMELRSSGVGRRFGIRAYRGNYEERLHLGWRIGLIGFFKVANPEWENKGWCVIHIPSGMRIGNCQYRWQAKLAAELFQLYGVSKGTTQEEVQADPLWEQMRKVRKEIEDFCY